MTSKYVPWTLIGIVTRVAEEMICTGPGDDICKNLKPWMRDWCPVCLAKEYVQSQEGSKP